MMDRRREASVPILLAGLVSLVSFLVIVQAARHRLFLVAAACLAIAIAAQVVAFLLLRRGSRRSRDRG
jgi:positive regulator of sigma E activity